jgi:hypothetical protein
MSFIKDGIGFFAGRFLKLKGNFEPSKTKGGQLSEAGRPGFEGS